MVGGSAPGETGAAGLDRSPLRDAKRETEGGRAGDVHAAGSRFRALCGCVSDPGLSGVGHLWTCAWSPAKVSFGSRGGS